MPGQTHEERLKQELESSPPPKRIAEIREHYEKTGELPAGALLRILGDPREGTAVNQESESLVSHMSNRATTR